jgi:hypothetical protein
MSTTRPVATLVRCALAALPLVALAGEAGGIAGNGGVVGVGSGGGAFTGLNDLTPGRGAAGAGRQVIVQGLIDLDLIQHDNYTDGNRNASDHRGYGLMRAELGLKIKLDERAAAVIGFGYQSDIGDYGTTNQREGRPSPQPNESQIDSNQSQVVLKDAYVNLKEFLGFEELGVIAGRMPVSWNLVNDRGAFLFDSRANNPVIGSWDGIRASYSGWDVLVLSPWVYRLPEASTLWGVTLDWKPATARGSDKVFVTGTYSEQREPTLRDGSTGQNLKTWSGGLDWRIDELGLWIDGAKQQGNAGKGRNFAGWGAETGLDWQFSQYGKGRLQIIGSWLSGDKDASKGDYTGFVNDWETISDTLIVENEKYGELSELVVGNLQALKVRWGIGFDGDDAVRVDLTAAKYQLMEPIAPSPSLDFGTEFDAQLRWQYTHNAQLRFFGGVLKPGDGLTYAQLAKDPTLSVNNHMIWLAGVNLNLSF